MPDFPMLVEQHHRLQYSTNVLMVAQQKANPLLPAVTMIPATGEAQSVTDLVNQVDYMRGSARRRKNVENPVSGSRRWVIYDPENEILSGQYIDREDKFRTATDPTSTYVQAHTAAVTRGQMDQLLGIEKVNGVYVVARGGLYGIAREGKTPDAGTPLPASQYLTADANGLTMDKVIKAVELLQLADFGIDNDLDPLFGLITPKQKSDLLRIASAIGTSANLFDVKQLESGKPTMLMGVNWIMSNRVPVDASGKRLVGIWSKANLIGGEYEAINGAMWNDTSADNLPYCRVRTNLDAVRAQDKGVVVIPCTE